MLQHSFLFHFNWLTHTHMTIESRNKCLCSASLFQSHIAAQKHHRETLLSLFLPLHFKCYMSNIFSVHQFMRTMNINENSWYIRACQSKLNVVLVDIPWQHAQIHWLERFSCESYNAYKSRRHRQFLCGGTIRFMDLPSKWKISSIEEENVYNFSICP